jgi:hypothetical protein
VIEDGPRWKRSFSIPILHETAGYRAMDHDFLGKVFAAMMSDKLEWLTVKDARAAYTKREFQTINHFQ